MTTVEFDFDAEDISEETKKTVQDTVNSMIDKLPESAKAAYLKEIHATFSKNGLNK